MTITRKTERRRAIKRTGIVAAAASLLAHMLLLALVVPLWLAKLAEEPVAPKPAPELRVEAVYDTTEPAPPDAQPIEAAANPDATEVELSPEISDAASETAMMVASREPAPVAQPEQNEPPPAPPTASEPDEPAVVEEKQSPIIMRKPPPNAQRLLMPSVANYEQMFAHTDEHARERAREHARGDRLFKNYERTTQGVRDALRSFGHDVKPGNHTGIDPHSNAFGSYIGLMHQKIHLRWANGYLMDLDLHEPVGSPMNDPTLNTKLELVIRAQDGELESVNIVTSSGQVRFDAQAIAIVHATAPHPNPPPELVSPNGRVYVHWNFWRDQRQCGTFGASVYIVAEQGPSPG